MKKRKNNVRGYKLPHNSPVWKFQYKRSLYMSDTLPQIAMVYLKHLPKNVKYLVCSSSSGAMLCSAMLTLNSLQPNPRELDVLYLKEGFWSYRKKQGTPWSYDALGYSGIIPFDLDDFRPTKGKKLDKVCFIDDVISTGGTFEGCAAGLKKASGEQKEIDYILIMQSYMDIDKLENLGPQVRILTRIVDSHD